MKSILDLDHKQAKKFFLESENYCSIPLPPYFDFTELLKGISKRLCNNRSLDSILKDKKIKPSRFEHVNYTMTNMKDGKYTFRPMQIVNPFLYFFLVYHITKEDNWTLIRNRFKEFQNQNIEVSSHPKIKDDKKNKKRSEYDITSYIQNYEQRSVELSLEYRCIFTTDISNCYGSIYTHTIAWAMHNESVAKEKAGNTDYIGNVIDQHIQWMQYNQTNGIPQGSTLFDFIAEIVLGYADKLLCERLQAEKITGYKILRYRDDYRIFSNNKVDLERISYCLQDVLNHLNFQLNAKKTLLSDDVITNSYKGGKLAYIYNTPIHYRGRSIFTTVQKELLYIRNFSHQNPNSSNIQRLLSDLQKVIVKSKTKYENENWTVDIAILTDIAMDNPKLYSNIMSLISLMVSKLPFLEEQKELVQKVYNKLFQLPNKGLLQLWIQRIAMPLQINLDYEESLCKIVANQPDINLWETSWVKDDLLQCLQSNTIVDREKLNAIKPILGLEEVALFLES